LIADLRIVLPGQFTDHIGCKVVVIGGSPIEIILSEFINQIGFAKSRRVEVDTSILIDSSRGVSSCVERFLEIESASLVQIAASWSRSWSRSICSALLGDRSPSLFRFDLPDPAIAVRI
jgi:hypothetical protein